MSAGNTRAEARTQALSEIFERHIKGRIISEGICLLSVQKQDALRDTPWRQDEINAPLSTPARAGRMAVRGEFNTG